jgi:hypothetical protein
MVMFVGACAAPQNLYSEGGGPSAAHLTPVRIADGFLPEDRARIVAAVADWNATSTGNQLNVVTGGPAGGGTWTVAPQNNAVLASAEDWGIRPIAVRRPSSDGGGSIVVDVSRLGPRDLRDVMMNEFAAVAGAGNGALDAGSSSIGTPAAR